MNTKNLNNNTSIKKFLLTLAIELSLYTVLVVAYFLVVLRLLNGILTGLFQSNLVTYAFLGLGLVVTQGVVLEWVTSFILSRLNIERVE
jgi:hypothetical protein